MPEPWASTDTRPRAHHNRAVCREALGDLDGALEDLDVAVSLGVEDCYRYRAALRRKLGDSAGGAEDEAEADRIDAETLDGCGGWPPPSGAHQDGGH